MAFYKASYNLIWITFLAVSMAFVESAVVIYLRELYYPSGFDFPMVSMPRKNCLYGDHKGNCHTHHAPCHGIPGR